LVAGFNFATGGHETPKAFNTKAQRRPSLPTGARWESWSSLWQHKMAKRLGLESTLRSRGRPRTTQPS
jgi:hypothetical protein